MVIASRKLDSCEALAAEVERDHRPPGAPGRLPRRRLGPGRTPSPTAAYDEFGTVDVLVNNAGMSPLYDHVADVTEELYDKVLDVNLKGPFRLTALVGTRMAAGDGGSIINVSSDRRRIRPEPTIIPYAAAKAGLNAMTVGFAHAFGPKVRVNCIMPGPFLTDISKAWDMEAFNKRAETSIFLAPRRRAGRDRRRGPVLRLRRFELHHRRRPSRHRRLVARSARIVPTPMHHHSVDSPVRPA